MAAVGDRDIAAGKRPPELALQEPRECFDKSRFALGGIVIADEALELIAFVEDVLHTPAESRLHFRDTSRISTTEHQHALVDGQCVSQIVHELDDSGITAEAFSEAGEFHCRTPPHIATHRRTWNAMCAHCSRSL